MQQLENLENCNNWKMQQLENLENEQGNNWEMQQLEHEQSNNCARIALNWFTPE